MNNKLHNLITMTLLTGCFYHHTTFTGMSNTELINNMFDLLEVVSANAGTVQPPSKPSSTPNTTIITPQSTTSFNFPVSGVQFGLPKGSDIQSLLFSPTFTDANGNEWTADLPLNKAEDVFNSVQLAAGLGHTIAFDFKIASTKTGGSFSQASPTAIITAYDQTTKNELSSYAFTHIRLTSNTSAAQTRHLQVSDDYSSLNITFQPSAENVASSSQSIPKNQMFTIAPGAVVTQSTVASDNISLTKNVIVRLTVVSLKQQAITSSYFTNNWEDIQNAIANNDTVTFTINESNRTITSSAGTSDSLVAVGGPYLIIALDGAGETSVAITYNKSFTVGVNAGAVSVKNSTISLPYMPQQNFQFNVYSTSAAVNNNTTDYSVKPTYLNNQDYIPVLNIFKMLSADNPLSIFVTEATTSGTLSATLGFKFGTSVLREHISITANSLPNEPYVAVIKDESNQYHAGVFSAEQPLTIES